MTPRRLVPCACPVEGFGVDDGARAMVPAKACHICQCGHLCQQPHLGSRRCCQCHLPVRCPICAERLSQWAAQRMTPPR